MSEDNTKKRKRKRLVGLKNLLFEEVNETQEKETQKEPKEEQAPQIDTSAFVSSSPIQQPSNTVIGADEEEVNKLWKVLIEENLPGPDYVELKDNVAVLSGTNLTDDKDKLLLAAYNLLKRQYSNLTKETILNSIGQYIDIINREKQNGLDQFEQLRKVDVGAKQDEIDSLNHTEEVLRAEIEERRRQLGDIAIRRSKLEQEKEENDVGINLRIKKFEASVTKVLGILSSDKTLIENNELIV